MVEKLFSNFHFIRSKTFLLQLILSENTRFAIALYFQVGQLSWMRSNISEEANQICQLRKSDLSVHTKSDLHQIFRRRGWNISELDCKGVSRYEFLQLRWDALIIDDNHCRPISFVFPFSQIMNWPTFASPPLNLHWFMLASYSQNTFHFISGDFFLPWRISKLKLPDIWQFLAFHRISICKQISENQC